MVVEGNESLIKCGVVEAVEGDAVADVEAFGFVVAPWEDVGGDEEFADGQAGDGAAVVVVVEHGIAEVPLAAPLFGEAGGFGVAGRRFGRTAYTGAGDYFGGFVFRIDEKRVKTFLAERDEFRRCGMELVPHVAVELAGTLETLDPAQFERRVERGEVAEFHRHRTRCAPQTSGDLDDHRLPLVELPEA